MKNRSIPFQGFEYKAADKLPHAFNLDLLNEQLQYLKEHDEFISDKDARRVLINQSKAIIQNTIKI
jgi:uridine kinase